MRSKLLLFLFLLTTTAATAQTQMVLRAQSYARKQLGAHLGVDSFVHTHATGHKSTIIPGFYGSIFSGSPYYSSYPINGAYTDDSTAVYNTKLDLATVTMVTTLQSVTIKKYNTAGLLTEMNRYQPNANGSTTPLQHTRNTYTTSMLPDTILVRTNGADDNRRVHVYNGNQLVAIHIHDWNLQSQSGTDSFFVSGIGSDSVIKHYNTTPGLTGYAKYIRDTANRILIDSQFTGAAFKYARSFLYDTLGRITTDSVVYLAPNQTFAYDRRTYNYDALSGHLTSIISDLDWNTWDSIFTFRYLDSFTYNNDHQVTRMAEYEVTPNLSPMREENFYYGFPVSVPEAAMPNTLQLYPIPATSYINISMHFTKPQPFSVRVFDMQGRLVSNWQEATQKDYNKQIPLTNMAPGQYTVQIFAGSESVSRQFTVVR